RVRDGRGQLPGLVGGGSADQRVGPGLGPAAVRPGPGDDRGPGAARAGAAARAAGGGLPAAPERVHHAALRAVQLPLSADEAGGRAVHGPGPRGRPERPSAVHAGAGRAAAGGGAAARGAGVRGGRVPVRPGAAQQARAEPAGGGRVVGPVARGAAGLPGAGAGGGDPGVAAGRAAGRRAAAADAEQRAADAAGVHELLATLTGAIWAELETAPRNIDPFRRNLQRMYTDHLIRTALEVRAPFSLVPPEDARALARAELRGLSERIGRALDSP